MEPPAGAYYVMADISGFGFPDDVRFARHMVEDVGVAVVPGSSFFSRPELGAHLVRFAFCKQLVDVEGGGRTPAAPQAARRAVIAIPLL